jgi:uncharacterized protein YegP (UPF0339 family)
MAAARFQVVSLPRGVLVPAPREPEARSGSGAEFPQPREREFTWRFMSANNRSLARSAHPSPTVEGCLASIRALQQGLPRVVAETLRNGHGQWVWRVRLDGEIIATAARSYPRQIRAQLTCQVFLQLVGQTTGLASVQVMHR